MKRRILSLAFVCFLGHGFAQNSLKQVISGENGVTKPIVTLQASQQVAFNPVNAKAIFQLDAASDLVLIKSEKDELGATNYRYYQTYQHIPVENSMYIVGVKDGKLREMNGQILLQFPNAFTNPTPSLTPQQAVQASLRKVSAQLYAWQDQEIENRIKDQMKDPKATFIPKATLVWYNPAEEIDPNGMQLCYKVDVYARQPLSRADYFVNAKTGEIVGKHDKIQFSDVVSKAQTAYSGVRRIHSDYTGTNLRLRDYTKGNGVITVHGEFGMRGQDYISTTKNWSFANQDQAALDAHYGVGQTWSFYWENFNRNSYDGNGTALYSYVNDPTYIDNAFWDGSAMNFNKRSNGEPGGVTGIDVTGHELTHGVTQTTSGLIYSKESGAINESMSDIFGKLVQFWSKPDDINWLMSNDMDWIIRDMSNPNAQGQPDTYKGTYWYGGIFDNGGVHTNSGVGNFMFYLLVNGGVGTNDNGDSYNVNAIGFKKAASIIYRTNTVKLTPSSNYANWRDACISAASDLYGASSPVVTQVMNAWHAVGVGNAGVSAIAQAAPIEQGAVAISPNPIANGFAQISYSIQKDGNASLKVLGLNGLMMSRIELGKQLKGNHTYRFNASQLPKGNYVLVLEQDGVILNRTNFLISR